MRFLSERYGWEYFYRYTILCDKNKKCFDKKERVDIVKGLFLYFFYLPCMSINLPNNLQEKPPTHVWTWVQKVVKWAWAKAYKIIEAGISCKILTGFITTINWPEKVRIWKNIREQHKDWFICTNPDVLSQKNYLLKPEYRDMFLVELEKYIQNSVERQNNQRNLREQDKAALKKGSQAWRMTLGELDDDYAFPFQNQDGRTFPNFIE